MGTSYDPTTYLNQQATLLRSPNAKRPPHGRLRSSRRLGNWDLADYFSIARNPAIEIATCSSSSTIPVVVTNLCFDESLADLLPSEQG